MLSDNLHYPFVEAAVERRWAADHHRNHLDGEHLVGDIHRRRGSLVECIVVVVVGSVVGVAADSIRRRRRRRLADSLLKHHHNNHYLGVDLVDDCTVWKEGIC